MLYYVLYYGRETVKLAYDSYVGTGSYMILFYIAMIYIFCKKNKFAKKTMLYPIAFIFVAFAINPIVAELARVGIDANSYYRNYWLILDTVVIAYVAVCVVFSLDSKVKRAIIAATICVVLVSAGRYMFEEDGKFTEAETLYKLPSESVHLAYTMEPLNLTKDDRVLADLLVTKEIRMYDASVTLVYSFHIPAGGNVVHYEDREYSVNAKILYDMIYDHTIEFDEELLYTALKDTHCKYMIVYNKSEVMPFLDEVDWLSEAASTDVHVILEVGDTEKFA